jgi:hypothetical protein
MDTENDVGTNTNPVNYVGIINTKNKKKPYNITFKNFNPNEPKINANMKYSDKQRYRRYKTKTEPKLFSKIMVDDEEDLIAKIRKEFGIEDKTRKNYSDVKTSDAQYYEKPNPETGRPPYLVEMNDFTDLSRNDFEDLTGEVRQYDLSKDKEEVADEDLLPFDDEEVADVADEDEEEVADVEEEDDIEDISRSIIEDILGEVLDTEPEPLMREASRGTELSALTTKVDELKALSLEDLYTELEKRGEKRPSGRKPEKDESVKKKRDELIKQIEELDKTRGADAP